MNSFEFWAHMAEFAQMGRLWWFSYVALPALIVAGGAYLLMAFALRAKQGAALIFFWLVVAAVPTLLIVPSFYVSADLGAALAHVGFELPPSPQSFSLAAARQLGAALDALALYGIVGAGLSVVVMGAASLVGDVPVASPIVQQLSQSLTQAVTRAMNHGRRSALASQYGVLTVTQGSATGSQHGVRSATIGKQEADILITDSVVSRRHARLDVAGGAVRLHDEQSTNGTYVVRGGQEYELTSAPFELAPGDTVFLGPPAQSSSVALVYERSGG